MKRSFIPKDYRPEIAGSRLTRPADNYYLNVIADRRQRRELIVDLVNGRSTLPHLDPVLVKDVLLELFPWLASKKEKANA